MQSDSETEPESDVPSESQGNLESPSSGWFMHQDPIWNVPAEDTHATERLRVVEEAVIHLLGFTVPELDIDHGKQEHAQQLSNIVTSYLDSMLHGQHADVHIESMVPLCLELLQPENLSKLFEVRQLLSRVAPRQVADRQKTVNVCWADVLISRIGDMIPMLATVLNTGCYTPGTYPGVLEGYRRGTSLRATLQLPEKWSSVPSILSSDRSSPAAIRLAMRLLFAAYVMRSHRQHGNEKEMNSYLTIMPHLQDYIRRSSLRLSCASVDADHLPQEDRLTLAMATSIFSFIDTALPTQPSFRPHTLGNLLILLKEVFRLNEATTPGVNFPKGETDVAQTIIYNAVVPWAWSIWCDDRVADIGVVDHITSGYLLSLESDDIEQFWNHRLESDALKEPAGAVRVMSRILSGIVARDLVPHAESPIHGVDGIILRSTWTLLRIVVETPGALQGYFLELTRILYSVFGLLQCKTHQQHEIVDNILGFLAHVPEVTMRSAMSLVRTNTHIGICFRIEERICQLSRDVALVCREMSADPFDRVKPSAEIYISLRQLLQFLTLLLVNRVEGCFHRQSLATILFNLLDWIKATPLDSSVVKHVLQTFLTVLSVLENLSPIEDFNKPWTDETIWSLFGRGLPTSLSLACRFYAFYARLLLSPTWVDRLAAVSTYIIPTTMDVTCKPLNHIEGWDYLRDVLLLILNRQHTDLEEPLALLVVPDICCALLAILMHADANVGSSIQFAPRIGRPLRPSTGRLIRMSPWTVTLHASLRRFCKTTPLSQYEVVLGEKLTPYSSDLLSLIEDGALQIGRKGATKGSHSRQIIFCRPGGAFPEMFWVRD